MTYAYVRKFKSLYEMKNFINKIKHLCNDLEDQNIHRFFYFDNMGSDYGCG